MCSNINRKLVSLLLVLKIAMKQQLTEVAPIVGTKKSSQAFINFVDEPWRWEIDNAVLLLLESGNVK